MGKKKEKGGREEETQWGRRDEDINTYERERESYELNLLIAGCSFLYSIIYLSGPSNFSSLICLFSNPIGFALAVP